MQHILSSKSGVLYVGITSDLFRRLYEHKNKLIDGFTKRYSVNWLVYFEETNDIQVALARKERDQSLAKTEEDRVSENE